MQKSTIILSALITIFTCYVLVACGTAARNDLAPSFAASATQWAQTDWSGGVGPSTENQYLASAGIDTGTAGQFSLTLLANWFDTMWSYRQPISIDNSLNGNTLTEYQVMVTGIDTATLIADGKMNADCSDIRFAGAAGVPLDFVFIGERCDTADTRFWVKVDAIAASTSTTIYLYYGNPSAAAYDSWPDTFSYSSLTPVGIVGNARLAADTLNVVSLANGNIVDDGTSQLALDTQDGGSFPAAELAVGTVISATGLFYADGSAEGVDMLTPISFASTLFIHYANRYNHHYTVYAHWADATVNFYLNGALDDTQKITRGSSYDYNPAGIINDANVRIESDVPVHAHHYALNGGTPADAVVLYPATNNDLYGIPSSNLDIAAGTGGASTSWIGYDGSSPGSPRNLGANGVWEQSGFASQGTAGGFRISTDLPIGVTQVADADGVESTMFWPLKELGTAVGANADAQYIAVAAPEPNTTCTVYDNGGGTPTNPAGPPAPFNANPGISGTRDDVNFLYFGNQTAGSGTWVTARWMMECDAPVYAYYERHSGGITDEHNLWSYPQMRQFTYPTPIVGIPGTEERPYVPTGELISNAFDAGDTGSLWETVSFTVDDAANAVVKVRTGNDATMSDAPAFTTCNPITSGQDMSDNNCVTDADRYVQYQVSLNSAGFATTTFEEISFAFTPIVDAAANAGPDRYVVVGRSTTLDGSASRGIDLTYNWAIVEGSGTLSGETTATPTYTSDTVFSNEDVLIYLTVRDQFGIRSTDEMTIHVLATVQGASIDNLLVGNADGTLIHEDVRNDGLGHTVVSLTTDEATIELPTGISDYVLAFTSDNRPVIGLPTADDATGRIYFITMPIDQLTGTIVLHEATLEESFIDLGADTDPEQLPLVIGITGYVTGARFGDYIAAGDLDADGSDEIVVRSAGEDGDGWATIYTTSLDLIGVVVGAHDFVVNSTTVDNLLTTPANDIALGPGNKSLSNNLTLGELGGIVEQDFAMLFRGTRDFAGVTILESSVIDMLLGNGARYRALITGDINGDGFADVHMSTDDGRVLIFYGPLDPATPLASIDADWTIEGGSADDGFGRMLAIGDVNADGDPDLMIGAPGYGNNDAGAVFIVFGQAAQDNPVDVTTTANVMIVTGDENAAGIGGDLLLADTDGNAAMEIYTVKELSTVFKIDLLVPPTPSGSSSCQLAASATSTSAGLISLALSLVTLMAVKRRKRFGTDRSRY